MSTLLDVTVVTNSGAEHKFYYKGNPIDLMADFERSFHPSTVRGEVIQTITLYFGVRAVESITAVQVKPAPLSLEQQGMVEMVNHFADTHPNITKTNIGVSAAPIADKGEEPYVAIKFEQ